MKFEQALRAMRRGKTIKRKAWGGIKYWVSGGEVVRLPPSGSAPGRSGGVAEFSMQGLFEYTDWVIVRKKKRPDKPAPKVERCVFKDPRCEPDKGLSGGDVIGCDGQTKRVLNVTIQRVYYDYRCWPNDNRTFITSATPVEWADLANKGWTVISRAESK